MDKMGSQEEARGKSKGSRDGEGGGAGQQESNGRGGSLGRRGREEERSLFWGQMDNGIVTEAVV